MLFLYLRHPGMGAYNGEFCLSETAPLSCLSEFLQTDRLFNNIECSIEQLEIFDISETGNQPVRVILHVFDSEAAVRKGNVFNHCVRPADYLWEITGIGGNSGKADVFDAFVAIFGMHDDTYRSLLNGVHDDSVNVYVFDYCIVCANISGIGMIG